MNQSINDGGDCRTTPATPGLLTTEDSPCNFFETVPACVPSPGIFCQLDCCQFAGVAIRPLAECSLAVLATYIAGRAHKLCNGSYHPATIWKDQIILL